MAKRLVRTIAVISVIASSAACGGSGPRTYVPVPLEGNWIVAIMPLANYTPNRDAPDHLAPMLAVELARRKRIEVVDRGLVEDVLSREPWAMLDRLPPDLIDSFGAQLDADALLVGSVLTYGFRDREGEQIPQVSLSLRLMEIPGGRVLWSAVHSRDGADAEKIFGLGKVPGLDRLAASTVKEILSKFPKTTEGDGRRRKQTANRED